MRRNAQQQPFCRGRSAVFSRGREGASPFLERSRSRVPLPLPNFVARASRSCAAAGGRSTTTAGSDSRAIADAGYAPRGQLRAVRSAALCAEGRGRERRNAGAHALRTHSPAAATARANGGQERHRGKAMAVWRESCASRVSHAVARFALCCAVRPIPEDPGYIYIYIGWRGPLSLTAGTFVCTDVYTAIALLHCICCVYITIHTYTIPVCDSNIYTIPVCHSNIHTPLTHTHTHSPCSPPSHYRNSTSC